LGFFTASEVKVGGLHGNCEGDGRKGHMKGSYWPKVGVFGSEYGECRWLRFYVW